MSRSVSLGCQRKKKIAEIYDWLNIWGFSEETADWERELQEELQEYDVLDDTEGHDDKWDKEIEEMLKEDS